MAAQGFVCFELDTKIYPLSFIRQAGEALLPRMTISAKFQPDTTKVEITIIPIEEQLPAQELRWLFNRELIATIGSECAFREGKSMRRIFVQSAYAVTQQGRKDLEQKRKEEVQNSGHNASASGSEAKEETKKPLSTFNPKRTLLSKRTDFPQPDLRPELYFEGTYTEYWENQAKQVIYIELNPNRHMIPDIVATIQEMADICALSVQTRIPPGGLIQVELRERDRKVDDLKILAKEFMEQLVNRINQRKI